MNLSELKKYVDLSIEHLPDYVNPDNIPVLINLAETSIGARASEGIVHAGLGFDWEAGQFRLAPAKPLVHLNNSLNDVKPAVLRMFDGKNYYWCPTCSCRVGKEDRYCKTCGQKLR